MSDPSSSTAGENRTDDGADDTRFEVWDGERFVPMSPEEYGAWRALGWDSVQ